MSKTIDERVVSMEFDNAGFEKNVAQSMSTLDRLKKSLNLEGAAKGLDSVATSAKRVDLSSMGSGVDAVKVKFSALQVVAATTLSNITNQAVNAGKNLVSAFTIDPVKSGLEEYETQLNSVQTVLANTQSKGTTLNQVNDALNELNHYADLTIYNFTEMTRNIGTFTAAGVGLDESVQAIKGIANLAAVSGSSSAQASTAMYQLSQALAAGVVNLQDWNSVVNAGMGGEVFQNALKRTAEIMGTNVDEMIAKYGSFRESLSKGKWLTADILTETLAQFAGAYDAAQLKEKGYTDAQVADILKMGQTATDAATKVKTFTQLMDTLKEAAQSGWTMTWQTIIGDFEQAKELWTGVSDTLSGIINNSADSRNQLISEAFSSNWDQLLSKINDAGASTEDFEKKVEELGRSNGEITDDMMDQYGSISKIIESGKVSSKTIKAALDALTGSTQKTTKQMQNLKGVVDKVINGDFGNGAKRIEALTKAGYDYATVQKLVNKTLKGEKVNYDQLSDSQLKNLGYTEEQIKAIRQLSDEAKKSGTSVNQLIANMGKKSGRQLMIESISNAFKGLMTVVASAQNAWRDFFKPINSSQIYGALEAINKFSQHLVLTDEKADQLTRSFKGLVAALHIITTLTGGALHVALKLVLNVLKLWDVDLLSVTAKIGDLLVKFHDWLLYNNKVAQGIATLGDKLAPVIEKIKDFITALEPLEKIGTVFSTIVDIAGKFFGQILDWVQQLMSIPEVEIAISGVGDSVRSSIADVSSYLRNGSSSIQRFKQDVRSLDGISLDNVKQLFVSFKDTVGSYFFKGAAKLFQPVIDSFNNLGSAVSKNVEIAGSSLSDIQKKFTSFGSFMKDKVQDNIGLGDVLMMGFGAIMIKAVRDTSKWITQLQKPLFAIDGVAKAIENLFGSIGTAMKAKAKELQARRLLEMAGALGVLALAVAALARIDTVDLAKGVGAIAALAGVLAVLSFAISKFDSAGGGLEMDWKKGLKASFSTILSLAIAIKSISKTLEMLQNSKNGGLNKSLAVLVGILGALVAASIAINKFGGNASTEGAAQILALAVSIKIIVSALDDITKIRVTDIKSTILTLAMALGTLFAITKMTGFAGMNVSGGLGLLAAVASINVLVKAMMSISKLNVDKIKTNLSAFKIVFGILIGLLAAGRLAGKNAGAGGVGILGMAAAILIIVNAMKKIAKMDVQDINKSVGVISKLMLVFGLVAKLSSTAGKYSARAGVMFLSMALSITILAGVITVLSHLKPDGLARGVAAIELLLVTFGAIIALSYFAGQTKEANAALVTLAVTVGLLAGSIGALAMIDPRQLQSAVSGLSQILLVFGVVEMLSQYATGSITTLITLTLVVTMLAGILVMMSRLNVHSSLPKAVALSALLLSMTAALAILSKIKSGIAPQALVGLAEIGGIILAIGGVCTALGALNSKFPQIQEFMNGGLDMLADLFAGLGRIAGSLVGGFAEGATSTLPQVGKNLSDFATNAQGFLDTMSSINPNAATGAKAFADAALAIVGTDLLTKLSSWVPQNPFSNGLGDTLNDFADTIIEYSKKVSDGSINIEAIKQSTNAAKAITEVANAIPAQGGLVQLVTGQKDLGSFSEGMKVLGDALKAYSTSVSGINIEAINQSTQAMTAITNMAAGVPTTGGLIAKLFGDNSLGTFGTNLASFGSSLKAYSDSVSDGINVGAINQASEAMASITNMAQNIPDQGGALSKLFSDKGLGTFGSNLVSFGSSLKAYSDSVSDGINVDAINQASQAMSSIASMAQNIPDQGGALSKLFSNTSLGGFGSNLVLFGASLKSYASSVTGIDISGISNATSGVKSVVAMAKSAENIDVSGLNTMQYPMTSFGGSIAKYCSKVAGIDVSGTSGALTAARSIVSIAKSASGVDFSGLENLKKALNSFKHADFSGFAKAFNSMGSSLKSSGVKMMQGLANGIKSGTSAVRSASRSVANRLKSDWANVAPKFKPYGTKMMQQIANGMKTGASACRIAARSNAKSAASGCRDSYSAFSSAGKYVALGFASGISSGTYAAVAKARAMAQQAAAAARSALQVASPSKVFRKIGYFVAAGLADGIDKNTDIATNSARTMAQKTINAASRVMADVMSVLESDDEYTPTIRPIVDMSNVLNSKRVMSDMLSMSPSTSALVRSVTGVTRRGQNGNVDDVVRAVNELKKTIKDSSGDSYSIGNINYGDDTPVADAIRTLVHAVKIEGRV